MPITVRWLSVTGSGLYWAGLNVRKNAIALERQKHWEQIQCPIRIFDVRNLDYIKFTVNQAATFLMDTSGNTDWYDQIGQGKTEYTAVPEDYDGDGMTDIAIDDETNGYWFIRYSSGSCGFDSFRRTGRAPVKLPYLSSSVF